MKKKNIINVIEFNGLISYKKAWKYQKILLEKRVRKYDDRDLLLLLQHPNVYTLGRGANINNVKFDINNSLYDIYRIERGGEVTYHCPGQLVGYPILNLRNYRLDLHWYLRTIEDTLLQVLKKLDLQGDRDPDLTGVWLNGSKVAAVGINVSRWITMHGFALNINVNLDGFKQIIPCGISDKPVGSLHQYKKDINFNHVKNLTLDSFQNIFNVDFNYITEEELEQDYLKD